ncbi:MAG: hypothetical protein K0R93_241 [Anaerosolibacter sp.]|jgi:hypothetical protein|nr:hypothetical protein [Anaerosolibacter sp.]
MKLLSSVDGSQKRVCSPMRRVKNFDPSSTTKTHIIFQEPRTKSGRRSIPYPRTLLQN